MIELAVSQVEPLVGTLPACRVLGASRASLYRWRSPLTVRAARPPALSPRALSEPERGAVLARLHEERFVDCSPAQVYATLLDEGPYLRSERTMYRVLRTASRGPRAARPAHPSALRAAGAARERAEPAVVVGHHEAAGPDDVDRTSTCT